MYAFKTVSKATLFTIGVSLISTGSNLIQSDVTAAVILIILGVALISLYTCLVEKQSAEKAITQIRIKGRKSPKR